MPVPPEFNPTFNEEDISRAQEVCRRHSSPQVQVVRAKIALYLHEHPGAPSPHVARALGVHEQTVRKWRKRWTLHGFSLEDLPRPGRPRRFPP